MAVPKRGLDGDRVLDRGCLRSRKFVTLFSMLFGVSLFLVGGERLDKQKSRTLWRRLIALLLLATLHGFGIWWGDILSLYACTGMVMAFCRSWRPRTLMVVGVVLYMTMALRSLPVVAARMDAHTAKVQDSAYSVTGLADTSGRRKAAILTITQEAWRSWAGAYRVNTRTYIHQLAGIPRQIPATLGLMMIGLALFRSGFLSAQASTRHYKVVMIVGAAALACTCWLVWIKDVRTRSLPGEKAVELALAPIISLSYASGLILLLRAGGRRFLSPLASAGRMAFTNYLRSPSS